MTTIVDPGGTPVAIYNRSGTTIQSVAASGTTGGSATVITRYSDLTVLLVSYVPSTDEGLKLPSDDEVGDVFEIYATPRPSGMVPNTILKLYDQNGSIFIPGFYVAVIRKVSDTGTTADDYQVSVNGLVQ